MSNYAVSLAGFLFNKINDYQNDPDVKNTKPMLWPSGLYFTEKNLEKWIKEHNAKT